MSAQERRPRERLIAVDIAGRVPPHAEHLEAGLLSAILGKGGEVLDAVLDILDAEHFYIDANRRIFEAAVAMHIKGQPVDAQAVGQWLHDRERLHAIGGIAYLSKLLDSEPAVASAANYAQGIREKARLRKLIETCQIVAAEGHGELGLDSIPDFIDRAEQQVYDIAHARRTSSVHLMYDVVRNTFEQVQTALNRGTRVTGLPTGFYAVDEKTSGMHDGELIVVAGRTSMGKTAYVLNVAASVASVVPDENDAEAPPQTGVMIFSLEMPKEQLAQRMMCSEARVNLSDLRNGYVGGEKWDRLVASANALSQLPIWIDDEAGISVLELRAKVRRQQHAFDKRRPDGRWKQKIGLVIVDYLQLMRGREGIREREQQVSDISRNLKALAKELRVPVMALSQLNRGPETRGGKDKRPQLSDLRESGSIEQDADMVQFLYRPEYYINEKGSTEAQKLKGYAELIIAKQRNGPTGRVALTFIDDYTRFENRAVEAWREDDFEVQPPLPIDQPKKFAPGSKLAGAQQTT